MHTLDVFCRGAAAVTERRCSKLTATLCRVFFLFGFNLKWSLTLSLAFFSMLSLLFCVLLLFSLSSATLQLATDLTFTLQRISSESALWDRNNHPCQTLFSLVEHDAALHQSSPYRDSPGLNEALRQLICLEAFFLIELLDLPALLLWG